MQNYKDVLAEVLIDPETLQARVKELGAQVIGYGTIVRFTSAPDNIDGIPIKSLIDFESKAYENGEQCVECAKDTPAEQVRF